MVDKKEKIEPLLVDRTFKDKLLIADLIKLKINPAELAKAMDNWKTMISIMNALLKTGPKITDKNLDLKEFNKIQKIISKAFL